MTVVEGAGGRERETVQPSQQRAKFLPPSVTRAPERVPAPSTIPREGEGWVNEKRPRAGLQVSLKQAQRASASGRIGPSDDHGATRCCSSRSVLLTRGSIFYVEASGGQSPEARVRSEALRWAVALEEAGRRGGRTLTSWWAAPCLRKPRPWRHQLPFLFLSTAHLGARVPPFDRTIVAPLPSPNRPFPV